MYNKLKNRYPGIRFFEKEEEQLFFGRNEERIDLQSMIKVKPLVVLFAKSGIGKSSLINAGLIPSLEKENFNAIQIRLQDLNLSPADFVKKALKKQFKPEVFEKFASNISPEVALWEYIRACSFENKDNASTPLFIFDQFEEFFNHSWKNQKTLIYTLANLVNNRLPDAVQQQLRAIPRRERTREQLAWFSPIPIKILLSIRSDRLSLLDDLSVDIPTILRDRYHLKPLRIEQARAAIVEPAALEGQGFLTQPFIYKEETLDEILSHLSNEHKEIESFQLQILCQQIEREVWDRQQAST